MHCKVSYLVVVMELLFGIGQYGSKVSFGESTDASNQSSERVIMLNDLEGAIVSYSYPSWWTYCTGGCTGGMDWRHQKR